MSPLTFNVRHDWSLSVTIQTGACVKVLYCNSLLGWHIGVIYMVQLLTERICAEASLLHTESVWGTSETRGYRHGHRPSLSVVHSPLDDIVIAISRACPWYTHMQMPDTGGTLNCRPQYMSSVWNTLNLNHNHLVPNCTLCIRSNFNSVLSLLFNRFNIEMSD